MEASSQVGHPPVRDVVFRWELRLKLKQLDWRFLFRAGSDGGLEMELFRAGAALSPVSIWVRVGVGVGVGVVDERGMSEGANREGCSRSSGESLRDRQLINRLKSLLNSTEF